MSAKRHLVSYTLVCCVVACGGEDEEFAAALPFEKPEDIAVWATVASAVGVYAHVEEPIAVADGQRSFADPDCPTIEDDGTVWTARGGCTSEASDGSITEWNGTASIVRDGADRMLTLDDFEGKTGTFSLREVEPGRYEFEARLDVSGATIIDYVGSVQGGHAERTLWNGSGRVERAGFFAPNGEVEATTLDEVLDDDVCAGQPSSGRTTLRSGEDEAIIRYDGEFDCDEDAKAAVEVNGEDRGLVEGIYCGYAPSGERGVVSTALLLLGVGWCASRRSTRRARYRAPELR